MFCDDIPNGYLIACGNCDTEFADYTMYQEPCFCPACGMELYYWNACEW
jgi:rRNA maturation endonuclease Nob1